MEAAGWGEGFGGSGIGNKSYDIVTFPTRPDAQSGRVGKSDKAVPINSHGTRKTDKFGFNYFFFFSIFAPSSRVSDKPMAIACFGFVTFWPERPILRFPLSFRA